MLLGGKYGIGREWGKLIVWGFYIILCIVIGAERRLAASSFI